MARSRLQRHLQEQSLRNILLATGGIIIIIILMATFGINFLINFSLWVKHPSQNVISNKDSVIYIAPPVLNSLSEATKSAQITVSGYAGDKQTIKLYVNGKFVDQAMVNKDKQFSFDNVALAKGNNELKAKAINNDKKESDYSTIVNITYVDKPPALDISYPQDGQTISKGDSPIKVTGKTDPGIKVTVNDFWAITNDDGNFSYSLPLNDGDNTIKIVATDNAGNQTTKELKVKTN
ncbi:MAG TPA: hypothetical protein VF810_02650 [Patescibacteria group bacterium]